MNTTYNLDEQGLYMYMPQMAKCNNQRLNCDHNDQQYSVKVIATSKQVNYGKIYMWL